VNIMIKTRTLSMPELGLIAATRFALGMGVGLLLAGRLDRGVRIGAGRALAAVGALSTIPLALAVLRRDQPKRSSGATTNGEQQVAQP
jgi:hypothetical protein